MTIVAAVGQELAVTVTLPQPKDVKQSVWHNTCYVMSSLQAIASRYPDHLAEMVQPVRQGWRVRHFGVSDPVVMTQRCGPRFTPQASSPAGHTLVAPGMSSCIKPAGALKKACLAATRRKRPEVQATSMSWPEVLLRAYLATTGANRSRYGFPDSVLYWALGCRIQTSILPPPGRERAEAFDMLARRFEAGECVVLFANDHCWALVGASLCGAAGTNTWRLTLSDPRSFRGSFTITTQSSVALRKVHAYSMTLGAAATAHGSKFSLDKCAASA